jgi:tRNA-dihydrouridine synthase
VTRARRGAVIRRHVELIQAHLPERLALLQLRKHLAWYSAGLPFGGRLRAALFTAPDAPAVLDAFWNAWNGSNAPWSSAGVAGAFALLGEAPEGAPTARPERS